MSASRTAVRERRTAETTVRVEARLGAGIADVRTTVPFLDHMMTALSRYAGIDLTIRAEGDLRHHIIEDVALTVGPAIADVIPATAARYGERTVPMDEALVQAVLDVGGRPFYEGPIPSSLYEHWMRSFCDAAKFTLHLRVLRGEDRHHVVEAAFKALGFALRQAAVDSGAVFSTKGAVAMEAR
ncbi:MAG: imidazoleglycerol-phosphate dehydratase [Gemmatimonadaceae bacterium]|nr:imidazoleglycerol-phosphate dehydratase [Gemmatimonadaceae bacterium]